MAVSITVNEAGKGVYAAWRLLRQDSTAVSLLDDTFEGVVKSYWCAVFVLPFYGLFLLMESRLPAENLGNIGVLAEQVGPVAALGGELLFYVLAWWVAWPVIMDRLAPWLGCEDNFLRYVAAYNWAHAVRVGFLVAFTALQYSGLIPDDLAQIVIFAILIVLWAYHWFLLRNVLEVDGGTAVGLVAAEYAMAVMINQTAILAVV